MQVLEAALAKARKANRMLIISRLDNDGTSDTSEQTNHLVGDPGLLTALSAQVSLSIHVVALQWDHFSLHCASLQHVLLIIGIHSALWCCHFASHAEYPGLRLAAVVGRQLGHRVMPQFNAPCIASAMP